LATRKWPLKAIHQGQVAWADPGDQMDLGSEELDPALVDRFLDLEVDGSLYVDPPHGIAKRLMRFLQHPGEHVVLWGPVGSGKSTEPRVATRLVSTATLAALMALDLELDLSSEPQPWEVQASLCRALVRAAERQDVPISQSLGDRLAKAGLIERPRTQVSTQASRELTGDLLRELCSHRPVTLLVDGLEKAAPARAMSITRMLVETARDTSLAVVLSPALLTGPEAFEVLQNLNLRSMALRPARSWTCDGTRALRRSLAPVEGRNPGGAGPVS
jgi:hypothetical protein